MFSALFSHTKCIHFPEVYGVFSGIARKHTIDVSDEYEDLATLPRFSQNIGKTFELKLADHLTSAFHHTRTTRAGLQLGEEVVLDDVVSELEGCPAPADISVPEMTAVMETDVESTEAEDEDSDCSSVSTSYMFNVRSCDCSEDGEEEESGENESGFAWATISNVPVQLTVMERCQGTLFELMCLEPDTDKHFAWIAQVVFALCYAQRTLGFVHNDLHSNNVMYVPTEKLFLNYKIDGQVFRVPTYGRLIKLIDFDRGTGSVRIAGMKQPKFFMSDNFSPSEEAGGQYNTDPFYMSKYETIKPNPSFDLVRLATSLFWDLFPEGPQHEEYSKNRMFQTLMRWLTLEDGTSILFGKKEAEHDRYHGFHLYKAIARFCKDTAVPRKEALHFVAAFGVSVDVPVEIDIVL
jgi:hypothetical protein